MQNHKQTSRHTPHWLQRCVRRLVFILLGKQNAKNLYHKNHAAKQIEAYAKRRGLKVIACRRVAHDGVNMIRALDGMVYPLPDAKQKHAEKAKESISLWDKIKLYCKACNHPDATNDGECVPPVLNLKPGEWITHIAVESPNLYVTFKSDGILVIMARG